MDRNLTYDYASLSGVLTTMGVKVDALIRDLITSIDMTVLNVSHRVKTDASATKKIEQSGGKYVAYDDLHDMLGIRVVTHLASDVDKVVNVLRANFEVDENRSLDKLERMDPDRFGYLSHHLVVRLDAGRAGFAEWLPYANVDFEVQVRSILQHAWAEIEHDLGYKSSSGIPAHLKRRFARLAGLLETADSEFDAVSRDVAAHVEHVRDVIANGGDLAIDRDSIRAQVMSNDVIRRADRAIANAVSARLESDIEPRYADRRAEQLVAVGFESIGEMTAAIDEEFDSLVRFATDWMRRPSPLEYDEDDDDRDGEGYVVLSPGISLFYLFLHKRLQTPGAEATFENFRYLDIPSEQSAFRRIHDAAFGGAAKT